MILAELRKVILVASQFFEFLHSLGPERQMLRRNGARLLRSVKTDAEAVATIATMIIHRVGIALGL